MKIDEQGGKRKCQNGFVKFVDMFMKEKQLQNNVQSVKLQQVNLKKLKKKRNLNMLEQKLKRI